MASWRDQSTPLSSSSSSASSPAAAPSSGGSWRDLATPLNQAPAPIAAPAASSSAAPSGPEPGAPDWLPGAAWLNHMTRVLDDSLTFGGADKLGDLPGTGTNVAAERAKTQAAAADVGPVASTVAQIGGYMGGAGELGAASKIGGALAPGLAKLPLTGAGKWLGGVLGSGAEGALAGGAGALGHGGDASDAESSALWSGALGAGMGGLGGVTGAPGPTPRSPVAPTPPMPSAIPIPALETARANAYAPLSKILYDAKGEVHPEIDAADQAIANIDLTGQQSKLAKSTMAEVANLKARPQFTAEDIQKAQGRLDDIASSPNATDQDKWMAPRYSDALENVIQNGVPQTGVPRNWTPPPATPNASYAATVRDAGDLAHGRLMDAQRLQDWQLKAAAGGNDIGSQAASYLPSPTGMRLTPGPTPGSGAAGSPFYQATQDLAATARPESQPPWYLKHTVIAPIAFGAGNEAVNAYTGAHQSPMTRVAEDLAAFPLLMGGFKAYSTAATKLNQAAQQRAFAAAQVAASTGAYRAPFSPQIAGPLSDAARKLIFGQAAGQ
jgi:hypothetical protein